MRGGGGTEEHSVEDDEGRCKKTNRERGEAAKMLESIEAHERLHVGFMTPTQNAVLEQAAGKRAKMRARELRASGVIERRETQSQISHHDVATSACERIQYAAEYSANSRKYSHR